MINEDFIIRGSIRVDHEENLIDEVETKDILSEINDTNFYIEKGGNLCNEIFKFVKKEFGCEIINCGYGFGCVDFAIYPDEVSNICKVYSLLKDKFQKAISVGVLELRRDYKIG